MIYIYNIYIYMIYKYDIYVCAIDMTCSIDMNLAPVKPPFQPGAANFAKAPGRRSWGFKGTFQWKPVGNLLGILMGNRKNKS